jgi:hypothetical protein
MFLAGQKAVSGEELAFVPAAVVLANPVTESAITVGWVDIFELVAF